MTAPRADLLGLLVRLAVLGAVLTITGYVAQGILGTNFLKR